MSFASTLNEYINAVGCTNKELAAKSGISASAISRYRNEERTPEAESAIIAKLASGIATLSSRSRANTAPLKESDVCSNLKASLAESDMIGMDFHMRFDIIMHLVGISNAKMAEAMLVDPSYISRIRKGQRTPADMPSFADRAARLIAWRCLEDDLVAEVLELTGSANSIDEEPGNGIDAEANLSEIICSWLLGDRIVAADVAAMRDLYAWLDVADFEKWLAMYDNDGSTLPPLKTPDPTARFYYGINGMRNAEIDFLTMAADTHARELSMSSDMPLLQMELDRMFIARYRRGIANLLGNGCHVNIVHGIERPLEETIRALRLWIPFYLTGHVTPHYLKGIHNRLFCHVNYVCDSCALSSEAMIGHQEDGRYFFSTRPVDVAYFQKKMGFILDHSSPQLRIFRDDLPNQRDAFERFKEGLRLPGHAVCEGQYKNVAITSHSSECSILTLRCKSATVHFVTNHPKICYAVSRVK